MRFFETVGTEYLLKFSQVLTDLRLNSGIGGGTDVEVKYESVL